VAIEGVDGCGKTTQAKMLVDRLKNKGCKAMYVQPVFILLNVLTRSKGNDVTPISPRKTRTSQMSNFNKHRKRFISKKLFMTLLGYPYALATYIFIKFYLGRNKIVVCDRYFYQFFFDLFGDWCEKIVRFFPKADLTFFLDGNLDLFYSRMDSSFDASVGRDYYTGVLNLYRRISKKYGFIQIDASLDKEAINDIILMHLTKEGEKVLWIT
jgi:thymidylate kinase